MTDERLDQILKQALAPEIADTEIAVKQAGRNYYMKKIHKRELLKFTKKVQILKIDMLVLRWLHILLINLNLIWLEILMITNTQP